MGSENIMYYGMYVLPVMVTIFLVVLAFFIVGRGSTRRTKGCRGDSDSALDILKKRYAKGEITSEEYEKVKQDIS